MQSDEFISVLSSFECSGEIAVGTHHHGRFARILSRGGFFIVAQCSGQPWVFARILPKTLPKEALFGRRVARQQSEEGEGMGIGEGFELHFQIAGRIGLPMSVHEEGDEPIDARFDGHGGDFASEGLRVVVARGIKIGGNELGMVAEEDFELKKRLREGFEKGLLPCSVRRALLQCGVGFREPPGGGRKVGGFLCLCGRKPEDEEERTELGLHDDGGVWLNNVISGGQCMPSRGKGSKVFESSCFWHKKNDTNP